MATLRFTASFERDYGQLPRDLQRRLDKALQLLLENSFHPSLQVKKMEGFRDIWEARFAQGYRFTFMMTGDVYIIRRVGTHDVLRRP